MKRRLQRAEQQLRGIRNKRSQLLRIFLRDQQLIAGSYGEVFIRCGQPTCRCHQEGGHFATRLVRQIDGKVKTKIVRVADRERVKKASGNYRSHKSAIRELKKLHAEEITLLEHIVELKTENYE